MNILESWIVCPIKVIHVIRTEDTVTYYFSDNTNTVINLH